MNKIIDKIPGFPDVGTVPGFQNQQPISVSGLEGVANPNFKIIVWIILSGILTILIIFFFLNKNKNKNEDKK
jgi:hypothetical protein